MPAPPEPPPADRELEGLLSGGATFSVVTEPGSGSATLPAAVFLGITR